MPLGVQSETEPYVFFRFDVVVPAPRLTQLPRYEWPTKPSCPLFEYESMTDALISPRTLHHSPIEQPLTRSPATVECSATYAGPVSLVKACTTAFRRTSTGLV